MKSSRPPFLATKLLEWLASDPRGDALTGDLIEQYRQGRSAVWYWRQALLAILVCLARDRTLGGPAILGSLLVVLLLIVSVGRHPSSLGSGLLITDIALLSGSGALSVWVWRQRSPKVRHALTVGAQTGIILGVVLISSHAIEWFALFGSGTAQLVRGAGSVLLMLGLLGAAGSVGWERTRSILLSVVAGLWCASLAVVILLGFALTLNLAFEAHAAAWLHEPFVASGMSDPGAFMVRNSLEAAFEILIRLPIAALVLSFGGSLANVWITTRPRSFAVLAAWFTPLIFIIGVAAIWYAELLERAARPPFVIAGVLTAGIALCGAHPIWSSLSRRHRELPHGTRQLEKNEVRMKPATRSIVLFAGLGAAIAVLAIVGVGVQFFLSHRNAVGISAQAAETEFSQLRARFSSQQPLLDMSRRQASEIPGMAQGVAPLRSFHTVIFDTRGGQRLVRISVPYWFARRLAGRDHQFKWLGQLTFLDDTEFDPEGIRLSIDQLERRGPGLVAYYQHPSGGQFISWVE